MCVRIAAAWVSFESDFDLHVGYRQAGTGINARVALVKARKYVACPIRHSHSDSCSDSAPQAGHRHVLHDRKVTFIHRKFKIKEFRLFHATLFTDCRRRSRR